jgi:CRISPR-associated exonuclease Cas4
MPDRKLELTVTDLKQHAYCERIPYFTHVLPVEQHPTYPMQRGKETQAVVEALEKRRGFRGYGLAGGRRLFGLSLQSERLGLHGRLDLVVVTDEACFPVDFKDTDGPVRSNHRLQMAAYCLLVEEAFARPVPLAFVYLISRREAVPLAISGAYRESVLERLDAIRRSVAHEAFPEPTAVRARCTGCEFRNYCGDIW